MKIVIIFNHGISNLYKNMMILFIFSLMFIIELDLYSIFQIIFRFLSLCIHSCSSMFTEDENYSLQKSSKI